MAATANPVFDHHSSLLAHLLGTEGEDDSLSRPSTPIFFTALATPSAYDPVMTQDDVRSLRKQRKRNKNKQKRNLSKQERKEKKKLKKQRKKKNSESEDKVTTTKSAVSSTAKPKEGEIQGEQSTTSTMSFTSDGKQYDLAGNLITPGPPVPKTTSPKDGITPSVKESKVTTTPVSSQNVTTTTSQPNKADKIGEKLSSAQPNQTTTPSTSDSPKSATGPPASTTKATKTSKKDTDKDTNSILKDLLGTTDVNIFILPEGKTLTKKQLEKRRRKIQRQLSCPRKDYQSKLQQKCCLKSAKCFQSFPDDLDEFAGHQPGDNFDPAAACSHIDDALLCMSRVFRREECRATADVVNKNLRNELTLVNKIYKDHCQGTTTPIPQTTNPTNSPGGQGQMTAGTNTVPPMGVFVAAGVGGLLAILLVIIIVVLLKRKKRPRDGRSDEKVMFENSSNASSRYKSFTRKNSEVYAEIDERALANINRENNNMTVLPISESMTSLDVRPLPSAPGTITEDKTGYLTPRGSRERIGEEPGYDELAHTQAESGSPSYDKLKLDKPETIRENEEYEDQVGQEDGDCEYITPTEEGPKVTTNTDKPEENYHMYFVLEKQTG